MSPSGRASGKETYQPLVARAVLSPQPIFAAVDALDLEFLAGLDVVALPQFGDGQNSSPAPDRVPQRGNPAIRTLSRRVPAARRHPALGGRSRNRPARFPNSRFGQNPTPFQRLTGLVLDSPVQPLRCLNFVPRAGANIARSRFPTRPASARSHRPPRLSGDGIPRAFGDKTQTASFRFRNPCRAKSLPHQLFLCG